jgi:hypothetical protein
MVVSLHSVPGQLLESVQRRTRLKQPITKSDLSSRPRQLVELLQEQPFCRIEALQVRGSEPDFTHPPKIIQKLKMGADNGPRQEASLQDFLLKKQVVDLLETIAELGEGEIRSIEVAHGLPLSVEIERRLPAAGGRRRD